MKSVLLFGDFNTYGTPPMNGPDDQGRFDHMTRWAGVARAKLGPGWHIVEEGLPGRTTILDDPIEGAQKNGKRYLLACLKASAPRWGRPDARHQQPEGALSTSPPTTSRPRSICSPRSSCRRTIGAPRTEAPHRLPAADPDRRLARRDVRRRRREVEAAASPLCRCRRATSCRLPRCRQDHRVERGRRHSFRRDRAQEARRGDCIRARAPSELGSGLDGG